MADILKKITQLNKEKKPEDKSLIEELFPQVLKEPPPEETGISNLGTLGNSNLKMARDGSISGFQEVSFGGPAAPSSPPAANERDNMFAGMKEFTLDSLGEPPTEAGVEAPASPALPKAQDGEIHELSLEALKPTSEDSFGALAAPPPDPRAEERQRFILLIAAMLKDGRYEAAINAVREMRQQIGKPG